MTPEKIEQCKTEINLVAQVLTGIIEDMEGVEHPYICVSAHHTEKTGTFWTVSIHGNGKVIQRVDSEGVDGVFEEVLKNGNL